MLNTATKHPLALVYQDISSLSQTFLHLVELPKYVRCSLSISGATILFCSVSNFQSKKCGTDCLVVKCVCFAWQKLEEDVARFYTYLGSTTICRPSDF